MSACLDCLRFQGGVNFARNDLGTLRGHLVRLVVKVRNAKADLTAAQAKLDAHQAECEAAQNREPRRLLAAALSEPPRASSNNRLPVTGRCHTCDRAISGERRYCGRCLASRA